MNTGTVSLSALREVLTNQPSKELLVEIVNNAQFPNPVIKMMLFTAMQTMKQEDVIKFSKIAVVAIQYIETGNMEGLKELCARTGIPAPIAAIINGYASNYHSDK